jgi:hypothetical protein
MKLIFNWRMAALCLALGLLTIAFQHVQIARATSSPTFYPVGFKSYAGYPCPSSIVVGGQSIPLGTNCSAMNNTVSFTGTTPQSDQTGQSVVIGPNWTQQCRDGSVKSLGSYTWSGTLPSHNNPATATFMHSFPAVCPGMGGANLDIMILSRPYGSSWEWIGNIYIPG